MKILMVCLGNICRSPLAHGLLESKLSSDHWVDSAGTGAYHVGEKPDVRSVEVAKENGLNISHQKARQFITEDFDRFDRIYAMDHSNLSNIKAKARNEKDLKKIHLFLESNPVTTIKEVPDPYYGGNDGFKFVFQLINQTCNYIADEINSEL